MPINTAEQRPATTNQISTSHESIFKKTNLLQGYKIGSMNGGMIKPIGFKRCLANEHVLNYNKKMHIKMLVPYTVNFMKLSMNIEAYWVPDTVVWSDAEKFWAQKGGQTVTKQSTIPNLGGLNFPAVTNGTNYISYFDTEFYRDSWASGYIPRIESGLERAVASGSWNVALPPISVLPLRGFVCIWNKFLRAKEHESEWTEYKGSTVSLAEMGNYFCTIGSLMTDSMIQRYQPRARRQNSYYTDYRTSMYDTRVPGTTPTTGTYLAESFNDWLKKIASARTQAENAQKTDEEIIQELYGSAKIKQNTAVFLGRKTIGINYTPVTQTTWNTASGGSIKPEDQQLGQQGAYIYTDVDVDLVRNFKADQPGYLHFIATLSSNSVFENGLDRIEMNIKYEDNYNPDFKNITDDVLYQAETEQFGTSPTNQTDYTKILGFKRKFSELFKLPTTVQGDIMTKPYYKIKRTSSGAFNGVDTTTTIPQKQYAMTEQFSLGADKKYYLDYSDRYINENQAIVQDEVTYMGTGTSDTRITGQNQLFFVGIDTCVTALPVDDSIRDNFEKWGEE